MLPVLFACSVCGAGQDNTEWAYLAMTGMLSLLPLGLMAGVAYWLHRSAKAHDAAQAPRSTQAAD